MTVNKDAALQSWIQTYAGRESALFNFLEQSADSFSLVPIAGTAIVQSYVDGSAYKRYDFALQTMQPLSQTTDSTNTDAMLTMREWQDWIEMQEAAGNYPDFGEKCSGYRLEHGSNMPSLAAAYQDEQMAKYQFICTLFYMEEK